MFPLLSLANELVIDIVESISDRRDLISLAQTCSKLQPLAEASLFKTISVTSGRATRAFSKVLQARLDRYNYIHRLEFTPRRKSDGIKLMPALVDKMTNLRELWVESPLCNGPFERWWVDESEKEYMDMFKTANDTAGEGTPLRKLKSLKYNGHGINNRFSPIGSVLPIFFSPTLTHIHISCLLITGPINVQEKFSTPLRTLVLEECSIKPSTLYSLLSLPRGLESLSLQEANHDDSCNDDIIETFRAIRQQKHSLEHLQHQAHQPFGLLSGGKWLSVLRELQNHAHNFSDFPALTKLSLGRNSLLTGLMGVPHLVPPALTCYTLADVDFDHDKEWEAMLSRLYKPGLAVDIHRTPEHSKTSPLAFMKPGRVHKLVKIAKLLKKRNISVTLTAFQRHAYIPPYLYGERVPTPDVHFESDQFWELEQEYTEEMEDLREMEEMEERTMRETKVVDSWDSGTVTAAKIMAGYQIRPESDSRTPIRYVPPGFVDARMHPLDYH